MKATQLTSDIYAIAPKFPMANCQELYQALLATVQNILRKGRIISLVELLLTHAPNTTQERTFSRREAFFIRKWHRNIFDLHFLYPLLCHPQVTEIIFHHRGQIQVDVGGKLQTYQIHQWPEMDFQLALEVLVHKNAVAWNYTRPFASFRCQYAQLNFRASLVHHCLSGEIGPSGSGPKLFLRKLSLLPFSLASFSTHAQSHTQELMALVRNKQNIIIAGATNSGKTSLLNSLLPFISKHEHTLILEDTKELNLAKKSGVTHLLAQAETPQRSLVDFCHYALRMRPDRIILGEIRSEEIVPLVLSLYSGHKGLLATCHANSAEEVSEKLALLFALFAPNKNFSHESVKKIIESSIDCIIYMEKRKIVKILKF